MALDILQADFSGGRDRAVVLPVDALKVRHDAYEFERGEGAAKSDAKSETKPAEAKAEAKPEAKPKAEPAATPKPAAGAS